MAALPGEERVIISAALQYIPGNAGERPFTLGDAFSRCIYDRPLRMNDGDGPFDAVHVPRDIDTEANVKRWFMFDIGVTRPIKRAALIGVPLKAYTAEYNSERDDWTFKPRAINLEAWAKYCAMFQWGAGEVIKAR